MTELDPEQSMSLLRAFDSRITRRQLLQRSVALAASIAVAGSLLAACDDDDDDGDAGTESGDDEPGETEPADEESAGEDAEDEETETPESTDEDEPTPEESEDDSEVEDDEEVGGSLVIAGWGGRFTESSRTFFAEPFTEETGIEIEFVDAPGEQVARIMAQRDANNVQWDLVDALGAAEAYVAFSEELFAPMPDDLRADLEEHLNLVNEWGFAFSSLAFVIACNEDAAEACPTSPEEFWDVEQFPGPRVMSGLGPLQPLMFALLADGVAPDELFPMDVDRAFAKLEEIRPDVPVWFSAGDQMEQVLRDEEVVMGHVWSGRAYNVVDQGVNLQITWNQGIYDPGFWVVVDGAPNESAAWRFLEWVAKNPEAQAQWSAEMGYGVGNPEAFDFMDEADAERLADYPENFEQLVVPDWEWYAEHRDEIERRWTEFLAG